MFWCIESSDSPKVEAVFNFNLIATSVPHGDGVHQHIVSKSKLTSLAMRMSGIMVLNGDDAIDNQQGSTPWAAQRHVVV